MQGTSHSAKAHFIVCLTAIVAVFAPLSSYAGITYNFTPTNQVTSISATLPNGGDFTNNLYPSPQPAYQSDATGSSLSSVLASDFPTWTVHISSAGLNGTLDVTTYNSTYSSTNQSSGAWLEATYTSGSGDPDISNIQFIQLIYTNVPFGTSDNTYLDDASHNGNDPFYGTLNSTIFRSGQTIQFKDYPSRPVPAATGSSNVPNTTNWNAYLYIASYDSESELTVYDGIDRKSVV